MAGSRSTFLGRRFHYVGVSVSTGVIVIRGGGWASNVSFRRSRRSLNPNSGCVYPCRISVQPPAQRHVQAVRQEAEEDMRLNPPRHRSEPPPIARRWATAGGPPPQLHSLQLLQAFPEPLQLLLPHRPLLGHPVGAAGQHVQFPALRQELDLDPRTSLLPGLVQPVLFQFVQPALGRGHQLLHRRIGGPHLGQHRCRSSPIQPWVGAPLR